ncbi:hypothetical protein U1Q18_038463 [Sarracenia purpurea var. burkii]
MGPRKRNLPPRSKPPRTADNAAEDGGVSPNSHLSDARNQEHSKNEPLVPSDYASIKAECQRALTTLRRGNHAKALRLMKETLIRHENCAVVHRVQANLHVQVASLIKDNAVKEQHLKNAVESARRAVTLSPNSIEFAAYYAHVLIELSCDDGGYAEVVSVCERALSIDNPIDPAEECLQEDSQSKASTAEDRIADVRKRLHSLVQRVRGGSLSTSTKNLGNGGHENLGNGSLKPLTDVPMEVISAGTVQPNEMKKAAMTLEEQNREIEVKLAAARLLQMKFESTQIEGDDDGRAFNTNVENRLAERRKQTQLKRIVTSANRREQFRSYWDSMSDEKKWGLFEVRISDLERHYRSLKGGSVTKIFSEAMVFAEKNKTWKFWACFFCDEKFVNSELHVQHLEQEHKWKVHEDLEALLAMEIDADLIDIVVNQTWKPVDIHRAMKIIHNKSKCQLANLADEACNDNNSSCQEDKDHLSNEEPNKTLVCSGSESRNNGDVSKFALDESDGKLLPTAGYGQTWPLCDDIERTEVLEKIQRDFQLFLKHKFLTKGILENVANYAITNLKKIVPASQHPIHGLDQVPLCFCLLDASEMKSVHSYLETFSHVCGINMKPDKGQSTSYLIENWNIGIKNRIVFTGDSSFLRVELMPHNHQDSVADDCSAEAGTICDEEVALPPDSDALIYWLFDGPSIGEELASWTLQQNDKKRLGKEIGRMFDEDSNSFLSLCRRQTELESHDKALLAIENIWIEELEKREQVTNHVPQSYVSLLRRRHEELLGTENDAMSRSEQFELDEISCIIVKESSYKSSDLSSSVHADDCIKRAIQSRNEQILAELRPIKSTILRLGGALRQLDDKYKQVSYLDYRGIMLPLLKSFIQVQFEALVNENAKQKSEAFLSELSLDAKKNTIKTGNQTKLSKEKSKAKKKKKFYRKMKDPKATCSDELHVQGENAEQAHLPLGYDGDNPSSEFVVAISADELKQKEEALQHLEHELEELKLEKMLEHQRRIEDEAKQRHLAEQNKKAVTLIPENSEKMAAICEPLSSNHAPLGYDGNNPSFEFVVPKTADELKLKEEELKHNVEHELEGLKLEDMLDQRRSEVEDKQKHLAEQSKKEVALIPEKSEKMVAVSNSCQASSSYDKAKHDAVSSAEDLTFVSTDDDEYNCILNVIVKVLHAKRPFDELLKIVEMNYQVQFACDPDVKGCGKYNKLHNILSTHPQVFITVLCWKSISEKIYDVSETLTALSTEIDIGVLFEGLDAGNVHSLISMVCYYGRHYICFVYCQEQDKWIMYDDETMKIIGSWNDVLSLSERRILQPHLLFFEAFTQAVDYKVADGREETFEDIRGTILLYSPFLRGLFHLTQ